MNRYVVCVIFLINGFLLSSGQQDPDPRLRSTDRRLRGVGVTSTRAVTQDEESTATPPRFTHALYTATISERDEAGSAVSPVQGQIQVVLDNLVAPITYELVQADDVFSINPSTGQITVSNPGKLAIKTQGNKVHSLLVIARDSNRTPLQGMTEVQVTVRDENNQPPKFPQDKYYATVREGASIGTSVISVQAYDIDRTANLEYFISGQILRDRNENVLSAEDANLNDNLFRMVGETGLVESNYVIVSAGSVHTIELTVDVEDREGTYSRPQKDTATIIVYPQAGSGGISVQSEWSVSVREISSITSDNNMILQLVATDSTGQDVRFIKEDDTANIFTVHGQTGQVTVNSPIDYEAAILNIPELQFQVRVHSPPAAPTSLAFTTVKVTVENVNDNTPRFTQGQYAYQISEQLTYPGIVGVIQATDADRDSTIQYSITGTGANMFYIHPTKGYIQVAQGMSLNAAATPVYALSLQASDTPGGTLYVTNLEITVAGGMSFEASMYHAVISDTTSINHGILNVRAQSPQGSAVEYIILSGNEQSQFALGQATGTLTTTGRLTGAARDTPYTLTVQASDNGAGGNAPMKATATIKVWVKSPSGQATAAPVFVYPGEASASVTVPEEVPEGSWVTTVTAFEPSSASSSNVRYQLMTHNEDRESRDMFNIDRDSGVLKTSQRMDRERQASYKVMVQVYLSNSETVISSKVITVQLTDINDNMPSFATCPQYADPQRASVQENMDAGTVVTTVRACDGDAEPNNQMFYTIVCGNKPSASTDALYPFSVDTQTGVVTTEIKFDREIQEEYRLCIQVSPDDTTYPNSRDFNSDTVVNDPTISRLIISIADIDDNIPTFGYQNASFVGSVLAEAPFHTAVTRVQAFDIDQSEIKYSLSQLRFNPISGSLQQAGNAFSIDEDSGVVYTNMIHYLDFSPGYFSMNVGANTEGSPTVTSTLNVYLIRHAQLLRFVFSKAPEVVYGRSDMFRKEVGNTIGALMSVDGLRYHATGQGGQIDYENTDMCFHLIESQQVSGEATAMIIEPLAAYQLFTKHAEDLDPIYKKYNVTTGTTPFTVTKCDVAVSTIWWSGYWYLWWILIALAIILFILSVLCVCCLSRSFKSTKSRLPDYKQYTMLDPFVIPYEYEEATVHM